MTAINLPDILIIAGIGVGLVAAGCAARLWLTHHRSWPDKS